MPDEDPYFVHAYRINFDGTGLTPLTPDQSNHASTSPLMEILRRYLVSRRPGSAMALYSTGRQQAVSGRWKRPILSNFPLPGWQPPEVFIRQGPRRQDRHMGSHLSARQLRSAQKVPGRRRHLCRPAGIVRAKNIQRASEPLTQLGFVVVQIDGMGTNNRSKLSTT